MTLNIHQVSDYMTQRKKGVTRHISAMKASISVRSARRIEKDQWSKTGSRHWRTRKDPLENVWNNEFVPPVEGKACSDAYGPAGNAAESISRSVSQ